MFEKGPSTRQRLLDISLDLFRRNGFDKTTMRDIAKAAGMATGAAYYHFPSKEAIVSAYFITVQERHLAAMEEGIAGATSLRDRLAVAYRTAIDVIAADRMMLHVVMRTLGDRDHPLSVMGPATYEVREMSRLIYEQALRGAAVPEDMLPLASRAAAALQMALVLYLFYDTSDDCAKTYRLAAAAAELAADLLGAVSSPIGQAFAKPLLARLERVLQDAELLPR